jgi:hypothetical protein
MPLNQSHCCASETESSEQVIPLDRSISHPTLSGACFAQHEINLLAFVPRAKQRRTKVPIKVNRLQIEPGTMESLSHKLGVAARSIISGARPKAFKVMEKPSEQVKINKRRSKEDHLRGKKRLH